MFAGKKKRKRILKFYDEEEQADVALDGKIDDATYQKQNNKLVEERAHIEPELSARNNDPEGATRAIAGLEILSGLEKCYKNADKYGKADLLRVVGERYTLSAGNKIVVEYKEPFKAIYEAKLNNGCEEQSSLPNKKTAQLNQGCLENYAENLSKNALKSSSKKDWGG